VINTAPKEEDRHRRDPFHRIGSDLSAYGEACTQWDVGKEGWRGAPITKIRVPDSTEGHQATPLEGGIGGYVGIVGMSVAWCATQLLGWDLLSCPP